MIFQYTLDNVLSGRKTQTRRRVHPNEEARHDDEGRIAAVLHNERLKWQVGRTYAVQPGRNAKQVARIRIDCIERETLRDISDTGAAAEGYDNREAFFHAWREIHGDDMLDVDVWVLHFTLVDKP